MNREVAAIPRDERLAVPAHAHAPRKDGREPRDSSRSIVHGEPCTRGAVGIAQVEPLEPLEGRLAAAVRVQRLPHQRQVAHDVGLADFKSHGVR